jgi:hypothetical protein
LISKGRTEHTVLYTIYQKKYSTNSKMFLCIALLFSVYTVWFLHTAFLFLSESVISPPFV